MNILVHIILNYLLLISILVGPWLRPLATADAQVLAWVNPCGTCCGRSGTGRDFSLSYLVFRCQNHSTGGPYSYIIWGMNNRPIGGHSSETKSHPNDMKPATLTGGGRSVQNKFADCHTFSACTMNNICFYMYL
jgi:hypothetical protein